MKNVMAEPSALKGAPIFIKSEVEYLNWHLDNNSYPIGLDQSSGSDVHKAAGFLRDLQETSELSPSVSFDVKSDSASGSWSSETYGPIPPTHASSSVAADVPEFKCTFCGARFTSITDLSLHLRSHVASGLTVPLYVPNTVKTLLFAVAPNMLDQVSSLNDGKHRSQILKGIKPIKKELNNCEICSKVFMYKAAMTTHQALHQSSALTCETCNRKFKRRSSLLRHARVHSGEKKKKISCKFCEKQFTQRSHMNRHLKSIHNGERHKCKKCGAAFSTKSNLATHARVHNKQKPYKCEECSKAYAYKISLVEHMRSHTGLKPFKCNLCQKRFARKRTLNSHLKAHHGLKPFKCSVCVMSFANEEGLMEHMRRHKYVMRHRCNACGRTYASKTMAKKKRNTRASGDSDSEGAVRCPYCIKKKVYIKPPASEIKPEAKD